MPHAESSHGSPLGVGLLGCGWIAELAHLPTLERSEAARLVAIADLDPARRAAMVARFPAVGVYESIEDLLSDPDVDAILVALPSGAHRQAACQAFAAGKHVYVEKPLAASVADGQAIVEAWRGAGTTGGTGYNFRRNPIFVDARRRLAEGEVGGLVGVQSRFLWAADEMEGWRASTETGGGVLLDLASHHVDLVAALGDDPVVRVRCTVRSLRTSEDSASLEVLTEGGVPAQILVSFAAGAQANELTLVGRSGLLEVDLLDALPREVRRPPEPLERFRRGLRALQELDPRRLLRSPGYEPSFGAALEAFCEAAASGREFRPDPLDGLTALRVVEAARRSAAAGGEPVTVDSTREPGGS